MFDALKFDVAMVTQDGFDRLHKSIHYTYAWKYETEPADEAGEKTRSDNFMRALLTQWYFRTMSSKITHRNTEIRRSILQPMIWDRTKPWAVCCWISLW